MNIEEKKRLAADLLDAAIEGKVPYGSLVFFDASEMNSVLTPCRLELIHLIDKRKPSSVKELALLAHRLKQAVVRDLKLLVRHEIITLVKTGKTVRPSLRRRFVLFSLANTPQHKGGKQAAIAF